MNRHNARPRFSDATPRTTADSPFPPLAPWVALGSVAMLSFATYSLGADWVAYQSLGLPAGAWCAILAGSVVSARQRRQGVPIASDYAAAMHSAGRGVGVALKYVKRSVRTVATKVAPMIAVLAERVREGSGERFAAWLDGRGSESGIRVLDETGLACRAPRTIRSQGTEWFTSGQRDAFDATFLRTEGDTLVVRTPVRGGRDAAWFDWSRRCPLSYGSVFPGRIDPEQVTLADGLRAAESCPRVVSAIVDAAAAAARQTERLDLTDRLRGRTATQTDGHMRRLAELTAEYAAERSPGETLRTAARVSSAWLLRADLDDATRLRLLEAAARIAGDEPEVMLRLAAVRFAMYQDAAAMDALLRADRMLRCEPTLPGADPVLFIQSEFGHGAHTPMSVGRVAAGICLLCASVPAEKLAFIRDDLVDDMRYAGLLVGADQERTLLIEVFRALERARRAEVFALPSAKAA